LEQTTFYDTAGTGTKKSWEIIIMGQKRESPLIAVGSGRLSVLQDQVLEAYPGSTLKFTQMLT
jgi:hypothetical protein